MLAFAPTPAEARASFVAALLCLPFFLMLRGLAGGETLRGLTADMIAYVCSWAGFALASLPLCEAMGRRALWPRLVAAWNWVNLVQYVVLGVLALPGVLGVSGIAMEALGLIAVGYALWLQWFTARAALGVNGLRAAAFVALDLAIAVFLSGLVVRLGVG
ncbi:hypothetical protein [Roseomonas fluvialis]|nr:hypothetical protein [Roseomonas fluvialis]